MLRQLVEWIESGRKSPAETVAFCIERIAAREPDTRAWVVVAPREPAVEGPLRGIPFGAKDVFETRGMATEYGSPLFAGRKGREDAALVRLFAERGAVLAGKTTTAAFGYYDPPATRNPRAPGRTPGGSSSGSAAAVAAGMVPFALGAQTQGSVVRPAAFCGVVGFKPTFGRLPVEGILPFAPSLDTAGLFTGTADDMQLLWTLAGLGEAVHSPAAAGWLAPYAPSSALERMRASGWRIEFVEPPAVFLELAGAVAVVNEYEGARTHRELWERHGPAIGPKLAALVAEGLQMPEERYLAARDTLEAGKRSMAEVFRSYAVIMMPSAPGPAPEGLTSTGDPRFNSPWTGLGTPAITIPLPELFPPVGLQLAAAPGKDEKLLAAAAKAERTWGGKKRFRV